MNLNKAVVIALALSLASATVWADTFGTGPNQFDIDFVNIGNAGNDWDVYVPSTTPDHPYETAAHGFGKVDYDYRIGQFEITSDQFAKARLADGAISDGDESGGGANTPANFVSYHEAAKFSNWLTSGNAFSGAYIIDGSTNEVIGIDRAGAIATYGTVYVLPSEDEWYKAAYFDATGANGYSLFANGTGTAPVGNDINTYGSNSNPWVVGSGAIEQNGTYDMMGNVAEWSESAFDGSTNAAGNRVVRGGFYFGDQTTIGASARSVSSIPGSEKNQFGFRVAAIPEPGTISLMSLSTISLFLARTMRRKKRLGSSLLPVRRENACDVFESQDAYKIVADESEEWGYLSDIQVAVGEKIAAVWSVVATAYGDLDKAFWNRMVESYELRKAKRIAFRAAFKKRTLDAFDAFLAKIMK